MFSVQEISGLYETKISPKILKKDRTKITNKLYEISRKFSTYIPIDEIEVALNFSGYHLIQEDGTKWSGFFCGRNGSCHIQIADNEGNGPKNLVCLQWYKQNNAYEINCYLSQGIEYMKTYEDGLQEAIDICDSISEIGFEKFGVDLYVIRALEIAKIKNRLLFIICTKCEK